MDALYIWNTLQNFPKIPSNFSSIVALAQGGRAEIDVYVCPRYVDALFCILPSQQTDYVAPALVSYDIELYFVRVTYPPNSLSH